MSEYKKWSMAKGDLANYESPFGFGNLLKGRTFNSILDKHRKTHSKIGRTLAADVAGYGFVFDGLHIDKGLAIASGKHPESKSEIVVGDIFSFDTWRDVLFWLEGDRFSLMLCKPLKAFGLNSLILFEEFDNFIGNTVNVLNNGGSLFTQIPWHMMSFAQEMAGYFQKKYPVKVVLSDEEIVSPSEKLISAMEIVRK